MENVKWHKYTNTCSGIHNCKAGENIRLYSIHVYKMHDFMVNSV